MTHTAPIFTKLTLALTLFVKNFYIEFHENPANCTVESPTRGHGRTWYPKRLFFCYFLKEIAVMLSDEPTSKNNETLLFHGHLFSRHQPAKVAFSQFSNPCLATNSVSRNSALMNNRM